MKLSPAAKLLVPTLIAYIALAIFLTPIGRLETRPVSHVTGLGFASLGAFFVGVFLALLSLTLLYWKSPRAPVVAIVAAVLCFPAMLADRTGLFSSLRPPSAIAWLELVEAVVAIVLIGLGAWAVRGGSASSALR